MQAYKKLEVIIPKLESKRLIALLQRNGIKGYSYWGGIRGSGDRGLQDGEGLSEAFVNAFFVIACSEEDFNRIKEKLRVFLSDAGGVCMISDVDWLIH